MLLLRCVWLMHVALLSTFFIAVGPATCSPCCSFQSAPNLAYDHAGWPTNGITSDLSLLWGVLPGCHFKSHSGMFAARRHSHSVVIWWFEMDVGWLKVMFPDHRWHSSQMSWDIRRLKVDGAKVSSSFLSYFFHLFTSSTPLQFNIWFCGGL